MTDSTRAYPLYWPEGWPRTERHNIKMARFRDRSVYQGRRIISDEVRRFGGTELIISSNLELKQDGTPRSSQRQPVDRGVAIYFKRNKEDFSMGCDIYSTVEDNLWALRRTLNSLRQIERDGSPALIHRAFRGFAALPDPNERKWWEVLGVLPTASNDEIRAAYIALAKQHHPDAGGQADMFQQIQAAYDMATGKARK